MTRRQGSVLRGSFLVAGALAVCVLLAVFHATVSGAVERASHRRADSAVNGKLSSAAGTLSNSSRLVALTASTR